MATVNAPGPAPRHDVVAGALVRDGAVLLAHRSPARRWYPDVWDLPGGHREPGETPRQALVRELAEELGVTAVRCAVVGLVEGPGLRLTVLRVDRWDGEPADTAPEEHDELRWCTAADLPGLRLAHAAYPALLAGLLRP
ncbi:NUDIX domain-containing protein [Modestobacter muralis]|uniref:NUDIX domain-containing protein n=1 Tax=Modestobacter muralis TaxID=1608614 RepID=A0A6P0EQM0_9ACTN|nr:NUDIX domain-containing protein [Modestobacter muralis]NEK93073.1 NUDIX domain-containing protein [Modestobacter muralis]NEN49840.1 NUDIX domain-containing protein [Modestobacter muralis]